MAKTRKAVRAGEVKVEMDEAARATPLGGSALLDRVLRKLNLIKALRHDLPARAAAALYAMGDSAYALIAGLILGGFGIRAAELFRDDADAARMMGLEGAVPEEATMHRVLEDLAGLDHRKFGETYEPAGPALPRMDMLGRVKRAFQHRRKRAEEPERMKEEKRAALRRTEQSMARRCMNALRLPRTRLAGFVPVFGDATDLEVEGNCFDAARLNHEKNKVLRWFTLMAGPLMAAQELEPGNTDEGKHIPDMIRKAGSWIKKMAGARTPILGLFDSAYFEKKVVEAIEALKWHFIIGANQQRRTLKRIARERQPHEWKRTGPDARRGWADSEVCRFTHLVGGWDNTVTIVARRWLNVGELPLPASWKYAFVATRLTPADLPPALVNKYGFESVIWMLYGAKQGCENHYKTALSDLGLHHPPSGRLGVNQAFYALASIAFNIAMVLRYRVVGGEAPPVPVMDDPPAIRDAAEETLLEPAAAPAPRTRKPPVAPGMRLWRIRDYFFRAAATLVRSSRTLTVKIAAAAWPSERRLAWQAAWAAAGDI